MVDPAHDEVLKRTSLGRFQVVAGNGKRGSSGDGGPATEARLRLTSSSGIAITSNGTVYFADGGNDRDGETRYGVWCLSPAHKSLPITSPAPYGPCAWLSTTPCAMSWPTCHVAVPSCSGGWEPASGI